jgi:hypothetical protein
MKQFTHTVLNACAAFALMTTAGWATVVDRPIPPPAQRLPIIHTSQRPLAGVRVTLTAQPGSEADRIARQLMGKDLDDDSRTGERPLVLVASAQLGTGHKGDVLFVQLQSARECGSAGCNTVTFWKTKRQWVKVLDTVSGTIKIASSRHMGMHDLILENSGRWIWDGAKYASTAPTPHVGSEMPVSDRFLYLRTDTKADRY